MMVKNETEKSLPGSPIAKAAGGKSGADTRKLVSGPKHGAGSVIILCAHNDDNIIGAGGTIAKYIKEGVDVITIIFSYGEMGIPWLKEIESIKTRVRESRNADKVMGTTKTYFFGLKEGRFYEEAEEKEIFRKLQRIISIVRPKKIFTHSIDDPHPDHRAVFAVLDKTLDGIKYSCDIYSFDIWNPFNIRGRNVPKLVVDITDTFRYKVKAFSHHRSQWYVQLIFFPLIYAKAIFNGLSRGHRFAEVFYKIR